MRTGAFGGVGVVMLFGKAVGVGDAAEGALSTVCTMNGAAPTYATAIRRSAKRIIKSILACNIGAIS
jgi:hypothetical protein